MRALIGAQGGARLTRRRAVRVGPASALLAMIVLLVVGLGSTAAEASTTSTTPTAAPSIVYSSVISSNSGGANIRTCGNTGCSSLGWLPNGTHVSMMCYTDSQWVYPPNSNYASPRWFKVGTLSLGGVVGYVHSSLVAANTQTTVGPC